jgi:hypothetical protein
MLSNGGPKETQTGWTLRHAPDSLEEAPSNLSLVWGIIKEGSKAGSEDVPCMLSEQCQTDGLEGVELWTSKLSASTSDGIR